MQNSKFIRLLRTLSENQRKRLFKFIASPYFQESEELTIFVKYILSFSFPFQTESLLIENVCKALYPTENENIPKMRKLLTKAYQLTEKFIIYQSIDTNSLLMQTHLLEYYRQQQMLDLYEDIYALSLKNINNTSKIDMDIYLHQFVFRRKHFNYLISTKQATQTNVIYELEKDINSYYWVAKMEIYSSLLAHRTYNAFPFLVEKVEELLQKIDNELLYTSSHLVELYYFLLKMYLYPEQEHYFYRFYQLINQYEKQLPYNELSSFYNYLRNYATTKINNGNILFEAIALTLYKQQIQNETIYDVNKYLPTYTYKNIVTIALRQKEYEWVLYFIETYKNYLLVEMQESLYAYCKAKYYFEIAEYPKILPLLQQITYPSHAILLEIDARKLLLQTYYEISEWESLLSGINRLRVYLHRIEEISEEKKERNRNFVNILAHLVAIITELENPTKKAKKIDKLQQMLKNTLHISERNWLMCKIQMLMDN